MNGNEPTAQAIRAAAVAAPKEAGDVLAEGWYHFRKGEDGDADDFDLYSIEGNPTPPCPECVRVKIILAAPSKEAGPDLVLVPREPTFGMLNAMWMGGINEGDYAAFNLCREYYRAMIAAANPPDDQRQEGAQCPDCLDAVSHCECHVHTSPPPEAAAAVGEDALMEGWHGAINDATELFQNAPDSRYGHRAGRLMRWLKLHPPVPRPASDADDATVERIAELIAAEMPSETIIQRCVALAVNKYALAALASPTGVDEAMVRETLHLCPTDMPHLNRVRWMTKRLNDALAARDGGA